MRQRASAGALRRASALVARRRVYEQRLDAFPVRWSALAPRAGPHRLQDQRSGGPQRSRWIAGGPPSRWRAGLPGWPGDLLRFRRDKRGEPLFAEAEVACEEARRGLDRDWPRPLRGATGQPPPPTCRGVGGGKRY